MLFRSYLDEETGLSFCYVPQSYIPQSYVPAKMGMMVGVTKRFRNYDKIKWRKCETLADLDGLVREQRRRLEWEEESSRAEGPKPRKRWWQW